MREVASVMQPLTAKPDELIINIGDAGDGMYVIHSGKVKVHFEMLTVAQLGPREVFGEMAILEAAPRNMSITALEETQLFFINRTAFRSIVGETIAKGIVNVLISRIKGDNSRMIEEFKKREKELTDLVNLRTLELQQKNEELVKTQKYKEQFLANMSHEIRTPMNAVVGMTNLLLNTTMNDQQTSYLRAIKHASNNLLVIINDILDFSKIEAGKLEIEKTDFNLRQTIKGVLDTLRFKAEEKWLALNVHVNPDIPEYLVGDPVRLNQILVNLTGNGIKFTAQGSVTIHCKLLEKKNEEVKLHFSVEDTGIGIAADKIDKLFQSFSQAESDTTRKYGGTGLGLSISKQLVELQGGTIGITSEYGKGTTFYFELTYPIGKAKAEQEDKMELSEKLKDLSVLLVDDDDYNQIVGKGTLEMLIKDVKVDIASNGREALDMLALKDYDIILMDVQMPEMDGLECTTRIRQLSGSKKDIKIMAMTASVIKSQVDKCFAVGMNDYISKPFVPQELYDKINKLSSKRN
ncbi:MAG: ATP-binding protein [Chitinophagales bacterium]|nr:ATP-binding protein [Chitinophagales bacterium]